MIKDDFNKLLTAIADTLGVRKKEICDKRSQTTAKARKFLYHIIYNGLPHLEPMMFEQIGITKTGYYKALENAKKMIHESAEDFFLMNEIRVKVELPRLKKNTEIKPKMSATKRMFGFDYDEYVLQRMRSAMFSAKKYMRHKCSYGCRPVIFEDI